MKTKLTCSCGKLSSTYTYGTRIRVGLGVNCHHMDLSYVCNLHALQHLQSYALNNHHPSIIVASWLLKCCITKQIKFQEMIPYFRSNTVNCTFGYRPYRAFWNTKLSNITVSSKMAFSNTINGEFCLLL